MLVEKASWVLMLMMLPALAMAAPVHGKEQLFTWKPTFVVGVMAGSDSGNPADQSDLFMYRGLHQGAPRLGLGMEVGANFSGFMTMRAGYRDFGDAVASGVFGSRIGTETLSAYGRYLAVDGYWPVRRGLDVGVTFGEIWYHSGGVARFTNGDVVYGRNIDDHNILYGLKGRKNVGNRVSVSLAVTEYRLNIDYFCPELGVHVRI